MFTILALSALIFSCKDAPTNNQPSTQDASSKKPIEGTWQLVNAMLIEKGDTTRTDYTQGKKFIKVINDSHFSFVGHDLNKGKDTANTLFTCGAGTYMFSDTSYTEKLEFCNDRQWDGNEFHFTARINGDTLVQSGIEKVEGTGIDRLNVERYVRVK